ncbi:MAG: GNAT family N-acetyltransferase [Acidimicrobiia bacterium]|nr:GNAT family N-acetyltransferase [Acidimicrobiia bacterium]
MSDKTDSFESARGATKEDVGRLVCIARNHARSLAGERGADLLLRRELAFGRDDLDAHLRQAIDDKNQLLVVGTIDGIVFGYGHVVFEVLKDGAVLARLEQLLVEPEGREVGVGEAMMNFVIAEARRRGSIGIDGRALPGDRETKNFFESFGLKARQLVVHLSLTDDATPPVDEEAGPTTSTER